MQSEDYSVVTQALGMVECSAIARLYTCSQYASEWTYTGCVGAATIISDASSSSFFLKILNLTTQEVEFSQELYLNFLYGAPRPWFHVFEMDDMIAGLSFADPQEAHSFFTCINQCKAQLAQSMPTSPGGGLERSASFRAVPMDRPNPELRPIPADRPNPELSSPPPLARSASSASLNTSSSINFESDKDRRKREKKERKEAKEREKRERKLRREQDKLDSNRKPMSIAGPTNVTHVSHIGWDASNGFQIRNIPPEWKQLFKDAGVRRADLENPETAAFIYATVQSALASGSAPPPPGGGTMRSPPPPPTSGGRVPPPPPAGGGGRVPPPPPTGGGRAPPPPPSPGAGRAPPPPPMGGGGGGGFDYDDGSNDGGAPPPPPPPPMSGGGSGGGFLAALQGAQLRKADHVERPPVAPPEPVDSGPSLLQTLSSAMAARRADIKEDAESSDDDEDWSDDDWE